MTVTQKTSFKTIFIIFPLVLVIALLISPDTRNLKDIIIFLGIYSLSAAVSVLLLYKILKKSIIFIKQSKIKKAIAFSIIFLIFIILEVNLSIYITYIYVGLIAPFIEFLKI